MRLTQIKLAGFKSFVEPTTIDTPGQLVGIVGPNGCGKSNVIDAVRWVLGESKASALRGESMQDVIFNGAGDRKPVGRASVELAFDNSAGRIGGQWGQYAELSIKRVLTRDGDSSYYINNVPVRRRDIYDLFLGTGLGPRAYAIIEQGMISRVIEAKPEELRIFLEEAAGVSKYRERRKETEGRLADTRENLSRIEDIRIELGSQLERLEHQATVAAEYREMEARLKQAQHLSWFAKQQEAVRARERAGHELAGLAVALEGLQADLRSTEAGLEALRRDHYAAGDALHERQGAFYAANSEVSRLEQQLAFARDSESRIGEQIAELTAQLAALGHQNSALDGDRAALEASLADAIAARERASGEERDAQAGLPALDEAVSTATRALAEIQQRISYAEQNVRVAETRRENVARMLAQLAERRARVAAEVAALPGADSDPIREVEEQLAQENADLAGKQASLDALQATVLATQERARGAGAAWQRDSRSLGDLEARAQALAALQARVGHGSDRDGWLERVGLANATHLYTALDVAPGWNDAVEAVLRERLEALELGSLDRALDWESDDTAPPVRLAVYAPAPARHAPPSGGDALLARVRVKRPELGRLVADALHGVRCRDSLAQALADRDALAAGETFVTPAGHLVAVQSVTLFRPDGELHGVLARQKELEELEDRLPPAREAAAAARAALETAEIEQKAQQLAWHQETQALASQQRRCHELELELAQLRQAAEAAQRRRAELARDDADLVAAIAQEEAQREAIVREIADLQSGLHDRFAARESARAVGDEHEAALARGRERLRAAERASQEAAFAERSAADRLSDLARRREGLAAQVAQQQALLARITGERAAIDWSPVEEALQRQLAVRAGAEQALAAARDRLEGLGGELRSREEARLAQEQALEPARSKLLDMQLKVQAASLAEAQFAEQLAEAGADLAGLPEALKSWGRANTLPGEIARLTAALAALGAVNLAALDELAQARERKDYLDRQSADLTEAMSTLESAIRQIDRESRALLLQTFDVVNANFGKLFPALFGGGQAKLVLTGEEILDSGVQVFAQPPGKRNTSIHLLSGGEKALTATSLVFALFQLNPAPFCLLDEVDAPLDDPNTERFCRLVREMSAETQFLFISHNKITMELAHQLIGITMQEPGVSRVVAVDIAEAIDLASSAAKAA
ncbi:structural maintenance of chromosome 3 (chondroitin sulfate proteoglycan 6) [Burkholderiales bacterium]|nr:structural maintenance of chromosome 3 (chondroitin sulfate proteoglycan 6) [Burkholderiales bacterium]